MRLGLVDRTNTSASAVQKSDTPRNHALEERAWEAVPTEVPRLLARLLDDALPLLTPPPEADPRGGRPRVPLRAILYQAIMRVAWRQSLRSIRGDMRSVEHLALNPHGGVSRSTLSRFLKDPSSTELLEKLLAITTWPASPYEFVAHVDATGLTEEHFTAFYEEKRQQELRQSAKRLAEKGLKAPPVVPRSHAWNYAEILWTYRYTLVAAVYSQRGSFGEVPWSVPLLRRAALTLDIKEFGADKAYNAYYLDAYLDRHGIASQMIPRADAVVSGKHDTDSGPFRARIRWSHEDPRGFARRAYRRENAEGGNHAYKSFLGDQLYSKVSKRDPDGVAQRNETLCMTIAYNLNRLVLLGIDQGIQIQFAGGAKRVAESRWESLSELMAGSYVVRGSRRHLRQGV
jgi:hypothetical protein